MLEAIKLQFLDYNQDIIVLGFSLLAVSIVLLVGIMLRHSKTKKKRKEKSPKNLVGDVGVQTVSGALAKTRTFLNKKILNIFTKSTSIDGSLLDAVFELLYKADIGPVATKILVEDLKSRFPAGSSCNSEMVRAALKEKIISILEQGRAPVELTSKPQIILIVGVNGVGKTTTIGKLTALYRSNNESVCIGAADTYRAGAIDQLAVWAERNSAKLIKNQAGSDPASVAFDAFQHSRANNYEKLIIDTAGRLQNQQDLMAQLQKISKVLTKAKGSPPEETFLVIDATTGQNAYSQVALFDKATKISGLIITKLDGTAKGGVVIGLKHKFQIPIRYIGIGEGISDLKEFNAEEFASSLFG
jgi:fused signal recognition particle receptor